MLLENGNKEAVLDVSKLTAFDVTIPSTVDVPQDVPQDVTQGDALDIWIEEQIRKNPKITTDAEALCLSHFRRSHEKNITI